MDKNKFKIINYRFNNSETTASNFDLDPLTADDKHFQKKSTA